MPFLTEKLLPERYRADLAALVSVTRPEAIVTYPEFAGEVHSALHDSITPVSLPGKLAAARLEGTGFEAHAGNPVRAVIISNQVQPPSEPDFDSLPGLRRNPSETVLLQHSSGTTGLQKGVALSHQAVLNQLAAYSAALRLTPTT